MLDRRDYVTAIPQLEKKIDGFGGEIEEQGIKIDGLEKSDAKKSKMLTVSITASRGNRINERDQAINSTMLIARVYSWGDDITADVSANNFIWTRNSGESEGDERWNQEHTTGAKHITVTTDDVDSQAIFRCTVTHEGLTFAEDITVLNATDLDEITDNIGSVAEALSNLELIVNDNTDNITSLTNATDTNADAISDIRSQFVGLESTVDSIDNVNAEILQDLENFVRTDYLRTMIEATNDGLVIKGRKIDGSSTKFYTVLSDTSLDFMEIGEDNLPHRVAYISNNNLNIENGIIRNQLTVGKHIITTDSDSYEIQYVGS